VHLEYLPIDDDDGRGH